MTEIIGQCGGIRLVSDTFAPMGICRVETGRQHAADWLTLDCGHACVISQCTRPFLEKGHGMGMKEEWISWKSGRKEVGE